MGPFSLMNGVEMGRAEAAEKVDNKNKEKKVDK